MQRGSSAIISEQEAYMMNKDSGDGIDGTLYICKKGCPYLVLRFHMETEL